MVGGDGVGRSYEHFEGRLVAGEEVGVAGGAALKGAAPFEVLEKFQYTFYGD